MLIAVAITAGAIVLAVAYGVLYLIGRACLVCDKPTIDCLCPLEAESDDVDPDFAASVAAGYVQLPVWDPPVYPRRTETPKEEA